MSERKVPLYHYLLSDAANVLPPVIYDMHATAPQTVSVGSSEVTRGDNVITRFLADRLGMPAAGVDRPLTVTFDASDNGERISRAYPDATLVTHQSIAGPEGSGLLLERFGPFSLLIQLSAGPEGIDFELVGVRWNSLRLPSPLWPKLYAQERARDETYLFHVRIALPLLGRLIEYRGALQIQG